MRMLIKRWKGDERGGGVEKWGWVLKGGWGR